MTEYTIKDHISGPARFVQYQDGNLVYQAHTGLIFPVPISDTNDATFPATDKGILFMRWIRKNPGSIIPVESPGYVGADACEFVYYRQRFLIYKTAEGMEFPIPLDDLTDYIIPAREAPSFFQMWITRQTVALVAAEG